MKEPKRIPLTDSPRTQEPQKIRLTSQSQYDIEMGDDIWIKNNENHKQNDKTSIQQLESDETN